MDRDSPSLMAERLRRLEMAVEAAELGLWEWDVRTGDLIWNPRNRELFGVDPERPLHIGEYISLVHPNDREKVRAAYRHARDKPQGGDYVIEHRTAFEPGGQTRWVQARGRVVRDEAGIALVVGSTLDITDRKAAEERRSLILRELAHRAKNGILIMMTIVAQTAKGATNVKDFEEVLLGRLKSMADSQDLVTDAAGQPLALGDLLERALTPFDPARFDRDPGLAEVNIPAELVVGMALLLHELSTNAVKYGALSAPTGRVQLELSERREGRAVVSWREINGPPVKPVARKGFGSRLLDVSLRNYGGLVEGRFEPEGFQARIQFPTGGP